jgi:hypothetical protein
MEEAESAEGHSFESFGGARPKELLATRKTRNHGPRAAIFATGQSHGDVDGGRPTLASSLSAVAQIREQRLEHR